ncbi:solute carrier family 10 (sodium/bile acid cotransporter), member 7 [Raineyella antarctica]|uniref:Solute carrier family 10 (Sodium/bile acid cotransporter), member 7 n=1 Tax=Raineyella antarctica TaxID=1577474 RepID=A0A1G6GEU9_9ACTN|nr:bile acid:sodium symporter family protein [Raineyella antarctica]SDB80494.1 solute carrier family 10 (sodium/bile acid cotransporter), member 7 [Raineyella antarctica]
MAPAPRFRIDSFLLAIVVSAIVATLLPARGVGAVVLGHGVTAGIALLFFLYGARMHPRETLDGLRHWRLHGVILASTYLMFPLLGLALGFLVPLGILTPALYLGLLYTTLLPSTVQSSVTFTSIARGNVAGAVVSASMSNLIGVFLTPLLVIAVMNTSGQASVHPRAVLDIVLQILVPYVLGQLSRRWTAGFVTRHRKPLKYVDQGIIVLVVYSAFSAGRREQMWREVSAPQVLALVGVCLVILALVLALTWWVARRLGFGRADRIAIQFCGSKKSLATGLPMAAVLFAGQPIGLIALPLMIFHQAQLMACSALAQRYARSAPPEREPAPTA